MAGAGQSAVARGGVLGTDTRTVQRAVAVRSGDAVVVHTSPAQPAARSAVVGSRTQAVLTLQLGRLDAVARRLAGQTLERGASVQVVVARRARADDWGSVESVLAGRG